MNWQCSILNSHLSSYLQNNQAPTAEDEERILLLRESLNAEILVVQKRSNGSCDGTRVMDSEYLNALRSSLSRCQIILSPSRLLPKEIWGEIFVRCLSTGRLPRVSYQEAPLLLTHVSASWKDIALSTPDLWTRIDIRLAQNVPNPSLFSKFYKEVQSSGALSMCGQVSQWLQLSGSLPLKIIVSANYAVRSYLHFELLEIVFSFSNQLQFLKVDLHLMDEDCLILPDGAELPLLETLSVRAAGEDELLDPTSILHAPNLRHLSIDMIECRNISVPHTWSKLHTLEVNNVMDRIAARKILKQCQSLVGCSLAIVMRKEPTYADHHAPTIFHPHLKSLSLTYPGKDTLTPDSFFEELHPPNLVEFEWRVDSVTFSGQVVRVQGGQSGRIPARSFLPQLDKLETVTMNANGFPSPEAVSRFLQNMPPSVKTLKIGNTSDPSDTPYRTFESLILQLLLTPQQTRLSAEPTILLPNLENLHYFSTAMVSSNPYFQPFILARTSVDSSTQTPSPGRRLKDVNAWVYKGQSDMEELEKICKTVSDHIRNLRIPFRLEIHSREDHCNDATILLKEVIFDPDNTFSSSGIKHRSIPTY